MKTKENKIKIYASEKSPLYGLSNKRKLEEMIGLKKYALNKISKAITYDSFKQAKKSGGDRTVTAPNPYLKRIQRSAYNLMSRIEKPDWLISGSKGKCYIDNAKYHQMNQSKYALTLDIKDFYPNCTRKYVFDFLSSTMKMSNDVAGVLSDILTYKYEIPTGSPTSQLLAFFAYREMFDELHCLGLKYGCILTVYVDDLAFSSKIPFNSRSLVNEAAFILKKYGHGIKRRKKRYYGINDSKLFTGAVLDTDNRIRVPNNLHLKIKDDREWLENIDGVSKHEHDKRLRSLRGRVASARYIDPTTYPELRKR